MSTLNGICLITDDLDRLIDFYRAVLSVDCERDGDSIGFQNGGARLFLFSRRGMEALAPGSMAAAGYGSAVIEFQVEDVDREYTRIQRLGAPVVKPILTHPWGRRSFWFRDPDGNILNFYAEVSPAPVE